MVVGGRGGGEIEGWGPSSSGGGREWGTPGNLLADPSDHDSANRHALCCQQHPPLPIVP